jgi:hypothetical protein
LGPQRGTTTLRDKLSRGVQVRNYKRFQRQEQEQRLGLARATLHELPASVIQMVAHTGLLKGIMPPVELGDKPIGFYHQKMS